MKTSLMPYTRTRSKTVPVLGYALFAIVLFLCMPQNRLHAQSPRLSVQGILKKANGDAVNDDTYTLTFRLYTSENQAFNAAPWKEEQQGVEVVNGIYSTVLGNTTPLPSFNQQYFLGVTVGPMTNTSEMLPRVQLTSAPYALSIIGVNNQFPSSGQVIADSLDVNGGILTQNGAPGANGVNQNGYGFLGDKDSGLYSQAAGEVSLYVNNAEIVEVKPALVDIKTDATVDNLNLKTGGALSYNGQNDWRLVYDDNLAGGANNWQVYNKLPMNEWIGWNNGAAAGPAPMSGDNTKFKGRYLYPASNEQVLKKFYDLSTAGPYSYIKVKFKYYFIDTWNGSGVDEGNNDVGFAAFAETAAGAGIHVGWMQPTYTMEYVTRLSTAAFDDFNDWEGAADRPEFTQHVEMVASKNSVSTPSGGFWLMFGCSLNNVVEDERYGVGMIEIWVK